jgi:hypothetical protein
MAATLAVGLGGAWLFGGNADGFAPGLTERVAIGFSFGRDRAPDDTLDGPPPPPPGTSGFELVLDHARHPLTDAGAYFPGDDVPPDAVTGFRDYLMVEPGFRIGLSRPDPDAGHVTVVPWIHLGIALAVTSTRLDAPSLDGRLALRNVDAWPAPALGLGMDVRVRPWLALRPAVTGHVLVRDDPAESGTTTHWGAEWRIQPALDVAFRL